MNLSDMQSMQSIQFVRQRSIVKLAITALFIKVAFFLASNIVDDDGTSSPDEYYQPNQIYNKEPLDYTSYQDPLDYKAEWTPMLGEQLGLTKKEYRVKRRQYNWRLRKQRKQEGGLVSLYQQLEDGDVAFVNDDYGGNHHHNDVNNNIPAAMGYYNLSCPFEWSKYSCAHMQLSEFDEKVTSNSMQYYQRNMAEIRRAFDSVFKDHMINPQQLQQKPKRIFMTGDSLLRQLFISVACNAFSIGAVERSEVEWREDWPCPPGLNNCIKGGQHSGFDAASLLFTNGMEIHYVPHRGFAYDDFSKGEPEVLERMKEQIDRLGTIGFGTKTAFPPSGPMDVLVYNVGAHFSLMESRKILSYFASEVATPLMKKERRPKIVYVVTPSQHFNTDNGQYKHRYRMDDVKNQCVERVAYNPRADLEKLILKAGFNVDVLIEYDDLELGALHVQKGDCTHYCMPGAADLVAARLLESSVFVV